MKKLLFLALSLLVSLSVLAQEETDTDSTASERTEARDRAEIPGNRFFFGGNFALSFGNINTFVNISPRVGYRVTERFSMGVGVTYMYWAFNNRFNVGRDVNTSVYGGNLFARYAITNQVFAHAEGELLSTEDFTTVDENDRDLIPGFFVGGGYAVPLGRRSFLNIFVLYNLLYDNNVSSPYRSPIDVRVGLQL